MKEAFQQKVKDFCSRTGVTISRICTDESVNYSSSVKIREWVYSNKGQLSIEVADRIDKFIDNYKG